MRHKVKLNLDKLRLSFEQPEGLFDEMKKHRRDKWLDFKEFSLHIIDDGRGLSNDKPQTFVQAQIVSTDKHVLADLKLNNSAKFDERCFITMKNEALYTPLVKAGGDYLQPLQAVGVVTDKLELCLRTFTEIEIACDTTVNVVRVFSQLMKDLSFDMYINGKKVKDENRTISGLTKVFGTSRVRMSRTPSIYIKQKAERTPYLRLYRKDTEIPEREKDYITTCDGFGSKPFYRAETNLKNPFFFDFDNALVRTNDRDATCGDLYTALTFLRNDAYLEKAWRFFTDRQACFRKGDTTITMWDIVNGHASELLRKPKTI